MGGGQGRPAKAQDIFVLYYWPTYSDAGSDNLWSLFHSSRGTVLQPQLLEERPTYDSLVDEAGTYTATDRDRAQSMY